MKKLLSLALSLMLVLSTAAHAHTADLGVIGGADGPTVILISDDFDTAAYLKQQRGEIIKALGGVEGQTNVLLNGRCIAFTDAAPEAKDGRTMVPLRAMLEAMGAKVDYDQSARTATVTLGDRSFTHVIGSDVIELSDGSQVKMDTTSYSTEANRTMVPIRFFSQVLGYDVFWDNDYKLVFLLDRESFVKDVDSRFSVLNDYLAKNAAGFDVSRNYKKDLGLSGTVKLIDSINGDRSGSFSAKATALFGKDGMSIAFSADLSKIMALLDGGLPEAYREALAKPELSAIFGDKLCLKSPLFDALMTSAGETASSGAWYAADVGTGFSDLYQAACGGAALTVGNLLYAEMTQGDADHFYTAWSGAAGSAAMFESLYGDRMFTRSGGGYRCSIDTAALAAAMNAAAGQELYTAESLKALGVRECSIDLTLRSSGSAEAKCVLDIAPNGESALRVDCTVIGGGTHSTLKGTVQIRNLCDVSFNMSADVRATSERITAAPAAGETVVELADSVKPIGG